MDGISVRNKLNKKITQVMVKYCESNKGTSVLSYTWNWSTVDVESKANVRWSQNISVGDIPQCEEKTVAERIGFDESTRGYWQVYFCFDGYNYKINKNNAMANPWAQDAGTKPEITIRKEGEYIRLDFVFDSGNAYFYAERKK